jgi:hypothetical protein
MTDDPNISPPSESTFIMGRPSIHRSPKDPASIALLKLARLKLEVKLRSIDESSLSETQRSIYVTVTEILQTPAEAGTTTEVIDWDDIDKAESLIALLYSGAQLRQEIDLCLRELANLDKAEADTIRTDFQELLRRPVEDSNPPDDAMLHMCLLRLIEGIHWNKKKKDLVRELHTKATRQILLCLFASLVLIIFPYVVINADVELAVKPWWSMFALWTALTAGLFGAFFSRLVDIRNAAGFHEALFQTKLPYTLMRAGVGGCGALIAYFFSPIGTYRRARLSEI